VNILVLLDGVPALGLFNLRTISETGSISVIECAYVYVRVCVCVCVCIEIEASYSVRLVKRDE
jgi:hypothetical protein